MECYVYILQSLSTRRYYTGQTYDLVKRLKEHNSELAGHTQKEQPWKLIWSLKVNDRANAVKLERKIKTRGAQRYLNDLRFGM
jgi:putative endonuclease